MYSPDPQLNSIKSKMSLAYIHSLNATANYAMQEGSRDFDGEGIDVSFINRLVGKNRTLNIASNSIRLQLKAVSITSKSMIEEDETNIVYKLSRDLVPIDTFFLVVVVLPEENNIESWREHTPEMLILRKCAYYLHIPKTLKAGKIIIPKTNILTPGSFEGMFNIANQKDAM